MLRMSLADLQGQFTEIRGKHNSAIQFFFYDKELKTKDEILAVRRQRVEDKIEATKRIIAAEFDSTVVRKIV